MGNVVVVTSSFSSSVFDPPSTFTNRAAQEKDALPASQEAECLQFRKRPLTREGSPKQLARPSRKPALATPAESE